MKHNVSYRLRRDLAPYLTATYDALPDQLIRVGDVVMPRRIDVVLDEEFQPIVRFVLEVVDDRVSRSHSEPLLPRFQRVAVLRC